MPGLIGPRSWTMAEAVRPLSRATNAEAVVAAGIQKLNMSPTRNTESKLIAELHEAWAVKNGYRKKVTSHKQQAASRKHQAPSTKRQATS